MPIVPLAPAKHLSYVLYHDIVDYATVGEVARDHYV